MSVSSAELRSVLRLWASGVTIVTVAHEGVKHGMTVSSFSAVALDPPLISVNIERRTRTYSLMKNAGEFAVCFLASDQEELAVRFGGGVPDDMGRFDGLSTREGVSGAPLPDGCLAYVECSVHDMHPAGTHSVVVADVLAVSGDSERMPLTYFNRKYLGLADASNS